MDIEDAVALTEAFLDAEWAATVAAHTEHDNDTVMALVREANALLRSVHGAAMGVPIGRYRELDDADMAELAEDFRQLARRPLFLVVHHENALWGSLYACYTGRLHTYPPGIYGDLYYAADTQAGPRLVAQYQAQPTVPVMFRKVGGVRVDQPGPVVGVRPVAEPTWPPHLEHWKRTAEAT